MDFNIGLSDAPSPLSEVRISNLDDVEGITMSASSPPQRNLFQRIETEETVKVARFGSEFKNYQSEERDYESLDVRRFSEEEKQQSFFRN